MEVQTARKRHPSPYSTDSTAQRKGGGQLEMADCSSVGRQRLFSEGTKMAKEVVLMMDYLQTQG